MVHGSIVASLITLHHLILTLLLHQGASVCLWHLLLILLNHGGLVLRIIDSLSLDIKLETVLAFHAVGLYEILPIKLDNLLLQLRFTQRRIDLASLL